MEIVFKKKNDYFRIFEQDKREKFVKYFLLDLDKKDRNKWFTEQEIESKRSASALHDNFGI